MKELRCGNTKTSAKIERCRRTKGLPLGFMATFSIDPSVAVSSDGLQRLQAFVTQPTLLTRDTAQAAMFYRLNISCTPPRDPNIAHPGSLVTSCFRELFAFVWQWSTPSLSSSSVAVTATMLR